MKSDATAFNYSNSEQRLIIAKKGTGGLTKNQLAFNKLTEKIEKLQKAVEKKQLEMDTAMKIFSTDFQKAFQKKIAAGYNLILTIFKIYRSKKLSKTNQRHLKDILEYHLEQYFEVTKAEPDDTMKNILSFLRGMEYDKLMEQQNSERVAELRSLLDKTGVDTKGIDFTDEAAVAAMFAEANEKMKAAKEEQAAAFEEKQRRNAQRKKKSAKQLASEKLREDAAAVKQKSISTIYRQLAKLFHPDLEQDPVLKAEKELLMKELTAAFEAKDMHKLLMLELKWINKENDHLGTLADDKLAIYLQILKEQVHNLEREKAGIVEQPQYAVLVDNFGYDIDSNPIRLIKSEVTENLKIAADWQNEVKLFESEDSLKHVNDMIKDWKEQEEFDDDDFFSLLMKNYQ